MATDHGMTVEPVPRRDVCVWRGYEYRAHEPYPHYWHCSRCGVRLEEGGDE